MAIFAKAINKITSKTPIKETSFSKTNFHYNCQFSLLTSLSITLPIRYKTGEQCSPLRYYRYELSKIPPLHN